MYNLVTTSYRARKSATSFHLIDHQLAKRLLGLGYSIPLQSSPQKPYQTIINSEGKSPRKKDFTDPQQEGEQNLPWPSLFNLTGGPGSFPYARRLVDTTRQSRPNHTLDFSLSRTRQNSPPRAVLMRLHPTNIHLADSRWRQCARASRPNFPFTTAHRSLCACVYTDAHTHTCLEIHTLYSFFITRMYAAR